MKLLKLIFFFLAEIEIAFAIMAIAGLLSRRRFLFSFTVLFIILRTIISITVTTIDVYTVIFNTSFLQLLLNRFFKYDICK